HIIKPLQQGCAPPVCHTVALHRVLVTLRRLHVDVDVAAGAVQHRHLVRLAVRELGAERRKNVRNKERRLQTHTPHGHLQERNPSTAGEGQLGARVLQQQTPVGPLVLGHAYPLLPVQQAVHFLFQFVLQVRAVVAAENLV
ncbi:hypothetical protein EGW08_004087, partial [Elysia chlorotica]